jgi:hypothetical protein
LGNSAHGEVIPEIELTALKGVLELQNVRNLPIIDIFGFGQNQEYVLFLMLVWKSKIMHLFFTHFPHGLEDTCLHEFHYAFDHVDKSSEKDPKIQRVENAAQQPLLVPNCELEPIFNNFSELAELVGDIILLEAELTSVRGCLGQPLNQATLMHILE